MSYIIVFSVGTMILSCWWH